MAPKQRATDLLQARRRRMEHAGLWNEVVPKSIPGRLRYSVSRWRNGHTPSPTEDLVEVMDQEAEAHGAEAAARMWLPIQRLIDHWTERFGGIDELDLLEALKAEQLADGVEDLSELDAAADPKRLERWITDSMLHAGNAQVARVVARRRLESDRESRRIA